MTRDYRLLIHDIDEAITDIESFIDGMNYEEFLRDKKTMNAVIWLIHVIGEATKNIPDSMREKYKNVPWKYMARIRDKIAHFYFGIDYEIVWSVVKEKLPEIKLAIEHIIRDLPESN